MYVIQTPGREKVLEKTGYTSFNSYDERTIEQTIASVAEGCAVKQKGVVVTASIVDPSNYTSVITALNLLSQMRADGANTGRIFLVACENTVTAHQILNGRFSEMLTQQARQHVEGVTALVDRMCVALEEYVDQDGTDGYPTVSVRAGEYGSLKLELRPETEELADICAGNRVEFCKHLEVEKKIKGWLLNGTHWLLALEAFNSADGDPKVKLNEYLNSTPERKQFAVDVMTEMRDGIEALLTSDPEYAPFLRDIDPGKYLDGAAKAVLARFLTNDDTLERILARLRKPSPDDYLAVQSFFQRFLSRVDPALKAYEEAKHAMPVAATRGKLSLDQLVASGTFINGRVPV